MAARSRLSLALAAALAGCAAPEPSSTVVTLRVTGAETRSLALSRSDPAACRPVPGTRPVPLPGEPFRPPPLAWVIDTADPDRPEAPAFRLVLDIARDGALLGVTEARLSLGQVAWGTAEGPRDPPPQVEVRPGPGLAEGRFTLRGLRGTIPGEVTIEGGWRCAIGLQAWRDGRR